MRSSATKRRPRGRKLDRPANGTAAASTSSPCTVAAVSASPPAGVGLRRQHEPGGDQAVQTMVIDTLRWANIGLFPVNDRSMVNSEARFGSAHANGFHLLLCDGAVRLAAYAIGPYVFERLGNRSDGDVVSDW